MKAGRAASRRPWQRHGKRSNSYWETRSKCRRAELVRIAPFSARGMRCLYGRGDHYPIPNDKELVRLFGRAEIRFRLKCSMDIWLRKDGRMFVRFCSSRTCHGTLSFELIGPRVPPELKRGVRLDASWVPQILRDRYDEWIGECLDYPDE
jgi:hypothetical protein